MLTRFLGVFLVAIAGVAAIGGCERELSRETEVDVKDDGTVKKEEKTVTQKPDGSVTKTETETKSSPR